MKAHRSKHTKAALNSDQGSDGYEHGREERCSLLVLDPSAIHMRLFRPVKPGIPYDGHTALVSVDSWSHINHPFSLHPTPACTFPHPSCYWLLERARPTDSGLSARKTLKYPGIPESTTAFSDGHGSIGQLRFLLLPLLFTTRHAQSHLSFITPGTYPRPRRFSADADCHTAASKKVCLQDRCPVGRFFGAFSRPWTLQHQPKGLNRSIT